ncbi:DUF808 domain-containing protein [Cocleimonas flava]|jgi:predicted DNA repair protein MutK|uniref:Inner membrane protein YedI n=1 Tax=Cocleimonas flava TaxID=634765 RepID=A0A4R1F3B0_9GAMM|nr:MULTISPECIES: DUF808 domain-containing protein [Cocleimonas]MEB8432085.1 DUF808 domain-containing protein [Cocleimonas sp. KMM 6892]MEC4714829.1 DUF808 domain-containing protein [Cocleimonas sp. KMM 6895]MEC4744357.1 DUF808 domain-containing protein [Cocleimonas sp. KMM 6896]TCJ87052.1 hypothetical protein EV695_1553 [Cocleimonas flava]
MAAGSLLMLLDDIATVLDDVAAMSKVAVKKTAGVLGDDLALNAEQVSGIKADREIPVVWAVAKGSFKNKLILVPAALAISAFIPWLITPLLMLGGAFLCYEGFEKIAHKFLHSSDENEQHHKEQIKAIQNPEVDMVEFEKDKISGAIRTDFILSAEIVVIALGTVKDQSFLIQSLVVSGIALFITIAVYGLVAGIVRMDDVGLHLIKEKAKTMWGSVKRTIGRWILVFAPILMKTLTIVGTAAMFLVGGGILVHGFHDIGEGFLHFSESLKTLPLGGFWSAITPTLLNGLFGILAGGLLVLVFKVLSPVYAKFKS